MLEILYEDNHILALNKPAGLLTQPDNTENESVEKLAKEQLNLTFLHAIHRLDKPVSGIVLFAKSSKALKRLNQQMREKRIIKKYQARCDNPPKEPEQTLIHFLIRGDKKTEVVKKDSPNAKEAKLHYKVLENGTLEIILLTGRRHQIRAQLAEIGCPIKGDKRYGSKVERERLELHAAEISFEHPTTKEHITLLSPAPFV